MAATKPVVNNQQTKKTSKIANFFKGMVFELKKVHWPSKKELAVYTVVVIIAVALAAVVLSLMDMGFSAIFTKLLGL